MSWPTLASARAPLPITIVPLPFARAPVPMATAFEDGVASVVCTSVVTPAVVVAENPLMTFSVVAPLPIAMLLLPLAREALPIAMLLALLSGPLAVVVA